MSIRPLALIALLALVPMFTSCSKEDLQKATEGSGLLDAGKQKIVDGFKEQLDKMNLDSLMEKAKNFTGAGKDQVSTLLESLKGEKNIVASAIEKLTKGDGVWDELVNKIKSSLGNLTDISGKLKGLLGQ